MSHDQSITKSELSQAAGLEVSPLVGSSPDVVHEESVPGLAGRRTGVPRRGRQTVPPEQAGGQPQLTPQQRLLVLDTWMKSGLPAGDYAPLVGVSKHTLYAWKARFEADGPAGLMDQPRGGPTGSRLSDVTKRAVLMMKTQHPEWGVDRISALLARGPGLSASAGAVLRVLTEAGYQTEDRPTVPHVDKIRFFERATPNQLWQTDLFTFVLKRQNQRVYLVAFLDDHSRYIVSYGLHASQSASLVLEVFRAGIASYGTPQEVLTDIERISTAGHKVTAGAHVVQALIPLFPSVRRAASPIRMDGARTKCVLQRHHEPADTSHRAITLSDRQPYRLVFEVFTTGDESAFNLRAVPDAGGHRVSFLTLGWA